MSRSAALRRLRIAAVVCLAEALVLVVLGVLEITGMDSDHLLVGSTTAFFFFAYAAGLATAGRSLALARSWARAPLLLAQLIQIGLAWSIHSRDTAWAAVLLAVPALYVAVVLVLPTTADLLYGRPGGDDVPAP